MLWDVLVTLQVEFDEIPLKVKEAQAQKQCLAALLWNAPGSRADSESDSDLESDNSTSDSDVDDSSHLCPSYKSISCMSCFSFVSELGLKFTVCRTSTLHVV